MWTPQNAKDKDWQRLKTLHFHFSDPRSHWVHRKANTIKRAWGVALWSACSKCLVICSKPLNHFLNSKYVQNLKSYSAPPICFIRRHQIHWHSHWQKPNQFGLTDRISVSPRWPCKLSVACYNYFGLTEMCNRSHRDGLANFLLPVAIISVSPK